MEVHVSIDGRGQDAARSAEDGDNGGRVDRVLRQRARVHQFVMHLEQLEVEGQTTESITQNMRVLICYLNTRDQLF